MAQPGLAYLNGVQVVAGSNPAVPTRKSNEKGQLVISLFRPFSLITCLGYFWNTFILYHSACRGCQHPFFYEMVRGEYNEMRGKCVPEIMEGKIFNILKFYIIKALIHAHPLSSPRSIAKVTQENSSDSSLKKFQKWILL